MTDVELQPLRENWYVMAFGVELGPMSWDDLRGRASRGDLRSDSQVRQGEHGPFINAGEVPGLFGAPVVETAESAWFCELLGAELGPMPWKELCHLAERGTLRGDARVRCGQGEWVRASSVTGLVPSPVAAIERSQAPAVAVPPTKVPEPPAKTVVSPPAPSEPPRLEPAIEKKPAPVAHPPTAAPPKKAKKAAQPAVVRPRAPIRLPLKPLAVLACAGLLAWAGYFGWVHWPSKSARADPQKVAALYRQAYEQIKQFRGNPQNQSPAGIQFRFSRTVATLRKELEQSAGDSSAGRLAEAGTQLTQMLADCQAASGSAEASRFTDSEQRFLAILDSFQDRPQ